MLFIFVIEIYYTLYSILRIYVYIKYVRCDIENIIYTACTI